MGEKLQLVRKGREGRTVLGARGSALLALALTYIACTHPYYTKTQRRLGLQSAWCPHGSFRPKTVTVDGKVHLLATVTTHFLFSVFSFGQQSARLTNGLRTMCVFTLD